MRSHISLKAIQIVLIGRNTSAGQQLNTCFHGIRTQFGPPPAAKPKIPAIIRVKSVYKVNV